MCSSVNLSTTNPTWTGPLGEELSHDSDYVIYCIISYVNIQFFLHPLQIHNGCLSLFYQTPPPLQHAHVVCRSPRCSYLSFSIGSKLSLTNTSIYKSLFCIKIGHLHCVNWWASQIPVLQRNMLPPTVLLLVLKMETACSFKIFVSNNTNIRCHNPKHCQCEMLKPSFFSTHNNSRHFSNKRCLTKDRYGEHLIPKLPYIIAVKWHIITTLHVTHIFS